MNFTEVVIVSVKENSYRIPFGGINKAVSLTKRPDLNEKK